MRSTFRQRLLTSTLLFGMTAIAAPAYAQVDDDDNETGVTATPTVDRFGDEVLGQPSEEGAIIVTGSRIQRRDLTSTSPLSVVQDEEFRLSGAVNVEQVINTLPQVLPGVTAFSNNPGNGTATLNLRGLGSQRTLVLVNGRRWMFYDTAQVVDLNTIPAFLIDSVDVVTGGASAVYGSDALGGVVNFRLMTDLNGFMGGGQYSITEEGDGRRYNAYVAVGSELADGRGYVTAFAEYYKRGSIFQGDRDFSFFALGDGASSLVPAGSSTPPEGLIRDLTSDDAGNRIYPGLSPGLIFRTPGQGQVWDGSLYNYAPANYLMVPQERWLLGGYGEYEITPAVTAFFEATFVNNRVAQELAATPVTGFFDINVDGACQFLDAATCQTFRDAAARDADPDTAGFQGDPDIIEDIFVQRRTTDVGSRNTFDERNAFRVMAGVKGPITNTINYEAFYLYARTRNANIQAGNISRSAFQAGLLDEDNPLNIYGAGTLTQDMINRVSILAQNNDISQLQVANAAISGTLWDFGWGADPVGFAIGGEWRSVSAEFIPDTALSSGDVIGFNAQNATEGGYDVKEVFAELRVPILADTFVHRLELNGAARYSDYSLDNVGGVWAYSIGAEFAPIRDITFRGQYQRAVRAPNVGELFSGGGIGFPPATDPCATPAAAAPGTLRDLCIATGVPAGAAGTPGLQINTQIPSFFGGNPNLTEETSDTFTVGAVIRPSFIPRLAITIDYFNIKIDDAISTITTETIFDLCYFQVQDASSPFCQAIVRNPGGIISGEQFSVQAGLANIASLETSGVDLQVDYSQPLGFSVMGAGESRLNFFFLGTWTDKSNFTPLQNDPTSEITCSGEFGLSCGQPTPEYKWTSRLSLIDGPATVSLRWRHISGVDDDSGEFVINELNDYNLWDLSFAFDVNDNLTLNMGVNNLFDTEPQLLGDNQEQSNTYPGTYDVLGRDYFISANFRF